MDLDDKMKRGRGKPKEETTLGYTLKFRLDEEDIQRLNKIVEATGDNRSDIARIALRGYYMHLKEVGKIDD